VGCVVALGVISLEAGFSNVSMRGLSAVVFGLLLALIISKFVTDAIDLIPMDQTLAHSGKLVVVLIMCYLGMVYSLRGRDEFNLIVPYVKFQRAVESAVFVLLDTSVIIDGRVADLARTQFLQGRLVVPKFILKELQQIADSADATKRARGRHGLDVLGRLKRDPKLNLSIHDQDFPEIHDTDSKLVQLAKHLGARILSNDANLNRIGELQGVTVLNLHGLSQALRPVMLPGERVQVHLAKAGKERNQAVAYLGDGTMVVVENARSMIGTTRYVVVTSVLQTSAGRMVFAKPEDQG